MKTMTTALTAVTLAVASTAALAWGWDNNGYNDGWGNATGSKAGTTLNGYGYAPYGFGYAPYGYAPYGYAPYGYGVPVAPVEMTEEQKQAIADQQAKFIEDMQKARQQAAEFYANQPVPQFPEQDYFARMDEEREARIKESDARYEEYKQAAEERRKAHDEAFQARLEKRAAERAEFEQGRTDLDPGI